MPLPLASARSSTAFKCKPGSAAMTGRHPSHSPMVHCHNGGRQSVTSRLLYRWLSEVG